MLNLRPTSAAPGEDQRDALLAVWERMTEDARRVLLANAKALEETRAARSKGETAPW